MEARGVAWVWALVVLGVLAGCSTVNFVHPQYGVIQTPGVTITADDGSFVLRSGERFAPPFAMESWTCFLDWGGPQLELYPQALEGGARPVHVQHPALPEPLYGILQLCVVAEDSGPATRSYQIEIPESYIFETDGGRHSVVYGVAPSALSTTQAPWVVWLSRDPFPEVEPPAAVAAAVPATAPATAPTAAPAAPPAAPTTGP
jgi:hypothetical protein